jgi:response regulator RpfG family c-di-GMP phosphodiesterase
MKILVVDDDLVTRKMIQVILQRDSHEITEAEDGEKALRIVKSKLFDLILTDIVMPDMNGIGLLKELKANPLTARIPVLFCSAVSDYRLVEEGINHGIMGFILKPIMPKVLLEKVHEASEHAVPILSQPIRTARRLGVDMRGYKELLKVMIDNAALRLKEVGGKVEGGNIETFQNFARDLSASAKTLGALSLLRATTEADRTIPTAASDLREKHLFNLRAELERLKRSVAELN